MNAPVRNSVAVAIIVTAMWAFFDFTIGKFIFGTPPSQYIDMWFGAFTGAYVTFFVIKRDQEAEKREANKVPE